MARFYLLFIATVGVITCTSFQAFAKEPDRPNVLFIVVDDLRPDLGCYGNSHVVSPAIDHFAKTAMLFQRAYCQQSVCNPSRTSLMTGLRPDTIGVTGNHSHFRDKHPDVFTLPQHFKNNGYHSAAIGKIYHGVFPDGASRTKWDTMGDKVSWSEPAVRFGPRYYYTEKGMAAAKSAFLSNYKPSNPKHNDWTKRLVFGLATESPDVSDNVLYDGKVADAAVQKLASLKSTKQPFFLAVGFIKPHSPYVAPKKYFDLYSEVQLPSATDFPDGAPSFAGHHSGELRRYTDQPAKGAIAVENQRRVRHAYLACTSYVDAQIGRVLSALERLGFSDNTIVCLYGDHGYHLGEQGLWGKTTNFELDTRVPLIVRAPGMNTAGKSTKSIVELVDLYPTLCDLAGLPIGTQLEGKSFAPVLRDPDHQTKSFAISQYPRPGLMGYSIRNSTHRLTQWWDTSNREFRESELYDYTDGLIETKNVAKEQKQSAVVQRLSTQLVAATGVEEAEADLWAGFEGLPSGAFKKLETPIGQWTLVTGTSIVDKQHAKTGKQCLQISGGNAVVQLQLADDVSTDGVLTFWAERWTKRPPFRFRIEKSTNGQWKEIYNGDAKVRVGRPFLSQIEVPLLDKNIKHLRFTISSPPNTGVLIDDVRFVSPKPQQITSVQVVPLALPALVNKETCALQKLRIQTTGSLEPISLATVKVALQGTTDLSDVTELQLLHGDAKESFAGGRVLSSYRGANGGNTISLELQPAIGVLGEGDNFIWVACKLSPTANIDHRVGAKTSSITFSNGQTIQVDSPTSIQRLGVSVRDGGDDGVHTFRIPGLMTTNKGTLIGVYDVRNRAGGDLPGDIDVGMSRSTDGGQTWEAMKRIMDMGDDPNWRYDGIGDPTIMVDRTTGTIWCAATWSHGNRSWVGSQPGMSPEETGQFMLVKSDDDGVTWSDPINITNQIKKPQWSFILQGPGKGITMSDGTLVLPAQYQDPPNANDKTANRLPHSTFVYSRDHGKTWATATGAWDDTTESQIIELADGQLMINCRNNRVARRAVMTTNDLGMSWQPHPTHNRSLIEPGACMASLINVGRERTHLKDWRESVGKEEDLLLFSNPDSLYGRNHITIKASKDAGMTWPPKHHLLLDEQNGRGYSCLTMVDNETVGILYEGSQADMTFQRIKIKDILNPPQDQKTKNPAVVNEPAEPKTLSFARPFGDHMVLQADQPIRIWGRGPPNQELSVAIGAELATSMVDGDGKWVAQLPALPINATPQRVTAVCGGASATIQNVLIGEVWLCAGQSNMEWTLAKSDGGAKAIVGPPDPLLRLHNCPGGASGSSGVYSQQEMDRLQPDVFSTGAWKIAGPKSVGSFSAVGYFFAKQLRSQLKVPIGVINVSVGGTPIESWVSQTRLKSNPKLAKIFNGNWLENPILDQWCRTRAKANLRRGLAGELQMPSDRNGPNHSFKPGFMHDAGIKPFAGLSIRGGLWYQGESNADTPARTKIYDACFPLMVEDWRTSFRNENLPIAFVQLPALGRPNWPVFREFQRRSLSKLSNIGMAITIDTGHKSNVHPKEKRIVGERLATWALSKAYRRGGLSMGPIYRGQRVHDNELTLSFDHVGDQLKTTDGRAPHHFQVAGDDAVFHSAVARIDAAEIVLQSPNVPTPIHARYAWSDFPVPTPNLVNADDLPASPFTTLEQFAGDELIHSSRPNILLIVSEDNGPELGCYGDKFAHTPNLDQLAAQGTRFETAYVTQSVCSPSRGTLFTGLYPHQNGQIGLATHQYHMFREWPTTYSILKQAGYRTGLLGKTHVNPEHAIEDYVDYRVIKSSNFAKKNLGDYAAKSSEFINASNKPFFLTVNFPDAHWPLQNEVVDRPKKLLKSKDVGPMPYIGFDNPRLREHLRGYYNCMSRLDECVGELLEALDQSGKADNTLVIYIGDHGAQFARGKVFVTEGGLRIPFIVRWPGKSKPGLVSKQLVSTIDILPTMAAAAAGVTLPIGLPGKDLIHVIGGASRQPLREYLFGERNCDSANLHFPQRAIRDIRYKLIKTLLSDRKDPGAHHCLVNGASNFRGSPTYDELESASQRTRDAYATWLNPPEYQLYDLKNDPHEFVNRVDDPSLTDVKDRLVNRLHQWQVETDDSLRFPESLTKLTAENDECLERGIRSPKDGWKYSEYLNESVETPVRE